MGSRKNNEQNKSSSASFESKSEFILCQESEREAHALTWKKKMQVKLVKITFPNNKRQQKTKAPETFLSVTQTGPLSENYHEQRGAGTSNGQILSN